MATVPADVMLADAPPSSAHLGFIARYRQSSFGVIGAVMFAVIVLAAVFAPLLTPYGPQTLTRVDLGPPFIAHHLLGTDSLGRDVFTDLLFGARASLTVGLIAGVIAGVVGVIVGAVAGYFGGWVDVILSEVTNVFLMIPTFFLILIVVALFGAGLLHEMLVIGLTSWPANARLMRAQVLTLRDRTFVDGERAIGKRGGAILVQHVIPNGIQPLVANTTLLIAGAIITDAGLSFIGLGAPNIMSWGQMIYEGTQSFPVGWWLSIFPGIALTLTVMAFYFIGDGLGVALNPRLAPEGSN
jgi:peptide/nickel transport system permease protein